MRLHIIQTTFKKKLGICIGMIVIISLGITIFAGINSFIKTLNISINDYLKDNHYPDIVIDTDVFDERVFVIEDNSLGKSEEDLIQEYLDTNGYKSKYEALSDYKKKNNISSNDEAIDRLIKEYTDGQIIYNKVSINDVLKDVSGVIDVDTRLYFNTIINHQNKNYSSKIIVYKSSKFNSFHVWSQTNRSNLYRNVYIEKSFAEKNDIKIGDVIDAKINDEKYGAYVQKIITTPENLSSGIEYGSLESNYGYIYIDINELGLDEYKEYANQIFIKSEETFPQGTLKKTIEEELSKYDINTNNSYTYLESNVIDRVNRNIDPIDTLSKILPTVFYIITIVVVYLCLSIIIKSNRKNISIYRALGFSIKQITKEYCLFGVVIIVLSIILSIPLCYMLDDILCNFYENFFLIEDIPMNIDYIHLFLSYLLVSVICLLAIILNCRKLNDYTPNEAMSHNASENYEAPYLVKTLFNKTSPLFKFSLTTNLRNKLQLIFSIVCITCTIGMIFASLSFVSGNNAIINNLFKERINYDSAIYLSNEPSQELIDEIAKLDYVEDIENVKIYKKNIKLNDLSYEILINGIDSNSNLIKIPGFDLLEEDGIILDHYAANKIKAKVGDYIEIDNNKIKVIGISKQYASRTSYVSYKQASVLKDSGYGCLVCKCSDNDALLNYLIDNDSFISLNEVNKMEESLIELFKSFSFASKILIVFSIVIGLDVILICIKTNLLDRTKQISVLRSLGYTVKEISISNYIQILLQLLVSIVVGLPLGKGISKLTLKLMETSDRTYPYANGIKEILMTISIVILYTLIAQIISSNEIKKWILSENIKDGE